MSRSNLYQRIYGRQKGRSARYNKQEDVLLLPKHTGRVGDNRAHDGKVVTLHSNMRWCSDGFEISCWNKEKVRVVFSLDCCDREVMSFVATTKGFGATMVHRTYWLKALKSALAIRQFCQKKSNG